MSQIGQSWPREFKFVGGPSRKRRRNAPRPDRNQQVGGGGGGEEARAVGGVMAQHLKRVCPDALPETLSSPAAPTFDFGSFVLPLPEEVQTQEKVSLGEEGVQQDQSQEAQEAEEVAQEVQGVQGAQGAQHPQSLLVNTAASASHSSWPAEEEFTNPFLAGNLDPFLFGSAPLLVDSPLAPLPPMADTVLSPAIASTAPSTDSPGSNNSCQSQTSPESIESVESIESIESIDSLDNQPLPSSPNSLDGSVSDCGYLPLPATATRPEIQHLPAGSLNAQPSALYDTLTRMFARYDQEFCLLHITHDCQTNPFRFSLGSVQNFGLLRHCVLALSYWHLNYDTGGACAHEAAAYRRRSLQLLRDQVRVTARGASGPDVSLLDAAIVLLTLDCATSAFRPWSTHFSHAGRILHTAPTASFSPQRRSQLTVFAWTDVILALTNRSGTRLPASAIRTVIGSDNDGDDGGHENAGEDDHRSGDHNDFFAVTGCPLGIFRLMVRLAAYAHEHRQAASMSCVRFDYGPVRRLQRRILSWSSPAFAEPQIPDDLWTETEDSSTGDDSSSIDDRLDRYHCAESWRYALLLYIGRVLLMHEKPERENQKMDWSREKSDTASSHSQASFAYLSRRTLGHVKACRSTSPAQKQMLFPVFLAACETSDNGLRADALAFYSWWSARTHYQMFATARALLEHIWRQDMWWGAVIDERTHHSGKEFLLG